MTTHTNTQGDIKHSSEGFEWCGYYICFTRSLNIKDFAFDFFIFSNKGKLIYRDNFVKLPENPYPQTL